MTFSRLLICPNWSCRTTMFKLPFKRFYSTQPCNLAYYILQQNPTVPYLWLSRTLWVKAWGPLLTGPVLHPCLSVLFMPFHPPCCLHWKWDFHSNFQPPAGSGSLFPRSWVAPISMPWTSLINISACFHICMASHWLWPVWLWETRRSAFEYPGFNLQQDSFLLTWLFMKQQFRRRNAGGEYSKRMPRSMFPLGRRLTP